MFTLTVHTAMFISNFHHVRLSLDDNILSYLLLLSSDVVYSDWPCRCKLVGRGRWSWETSASRPSETPSRSSVRPRESRGICPSPAQVCTSPSE